MPPRCRRGRLAAAFPRPHVSGRLAPASAWAVWPCHGPGHWSLPPICSLPRVCYLPIAILSRLHTILGALTLRRRPAVTPSSAHTSLEQRSLSPGVTAPLSWLLPIRLPPLAHHRARLGNGVIVARQCPARRVQLIGVQQIRCTHGNSIPAAHILGICSIAVAEGHISRAHRLLQPPCCFTVRLTRTKRVNQCVTC